jgi:glycosyltransferase involved in cell wall biosynthesis
MSVRNNAKTLALSVQSIINQTYPHWELLLVDDGSTDETLRIAHALAATDARIKIWSDGQALGLPDRLNQTIDLSQGTYFARMDGDDIAYPQRLARQVAYLEGHPDVDLVGAQMVVFRADGEPLGKRACPESHHAITAHPTGGFPMAHPTYLGHLAFFQRFRYRAEAIKCEDQDLLLRASAPPSPAGTGISLLKAQDQDLLLRAYKYSKFANVPEVLLGYREDALNLNKILTTRRYYLKSMVYEFQRRGRPDMAVRATLSQGLKALVDIVAVRSGLEYLLLRHRAQPISLAERDQWTHVWATLQAGPVVV